MNEVDEIRGLLERVNPKINRMFDGADELYEPFSDQKQQQKIIKDVVRVIDSACNLSDEEEAECELERANKSMELYEDSLLYSCDYSNVRNRLIVYRKKEVESWIFEDDYRHITSTANKRAWWWLLVATAFKSMRNDVYRHRFENGRLVRLKMTAAEHREATKNMFIQELCLDELDESLRDSLLRLYEHVRKSILDIENEKRQEERDVRQVERVSIEEEWNMKQRILDEADELMLTIGTYKDWKGDDEDDLLEELFMFYKGNSKENANLILEALVKLYEDNPNHTLKEVGIENEKQDWVKMIDYFLENGDVWSEEKIKEDVQEEDDPILKSLFDDDMDSLANETEEEIEISEALQRKLKGSRRGGKAKGKKNHRKKVVLEKIFTGERFEFESTDEAKKYIEVSNPTWLKFKKGISKLNKTWRLIE